jgi:hypothetical protein
MKTIKLVLLVVTVLAFNLSNAQTLRVNEIDDFTGSTKKITKYYNIANGKGYLIKSSVIRLNTTYALFVKSNTDLGCAGAVGNYIIFKFVDGSTLKLKDVASIDCKDDSNSTFLLTDTDLYKFETPIEKIRFSRSELYLDATTTGTYSVSQLIKAVK